MCSHAHTMRRGAPNSARSQSVGTRLPDWDLSCTSANGCRCKSASHQCRQHQRRSALKPLPNPREVAMTTDLWARIRRLFRWRSPSRQLEQILAGYRPEDSPGNAAFAARRERLDLMKGWVPDRPSNNATARRNVRHPAHRRTRTR